MKVWTFILIIVGIYLIDVHLLFLISNWLKLTHEQIDKLLKINLVVMNIICFCVGLYFGKS